MTLTYSGQLVIETCWCGMRHAVPAELRDFQERQHRDGKTQTGIYCPLGHSHIIAGKGEAEVLRERLAEERRRREAARDLLKAEERSHAATRGVVTKQRKKLARVTNGVCPCCNRHFTNLERHMHTKHPTYDPATQVDPQARV